MGSWTALELHERRRGTTRARRLPFREGRAESIAPRRKCASNQGITTARDRNACRPSTRRHRDRRNPPLGCCSLPRLCSGSLSGRSLQAERIAKSWGLRPAQDIPRSLRPFDFL
jgi:hypothetical protein